MRFRFALALIPFMALSGCAAATQATTGSISQVAPDIVNNAKRALTAAHQLHASAANLLAVAANSNLCVAACATTAKGYLDQSYAALLAADKLVALGDASGIEAKVADAIALVSQAQSLIGKK